MNKADSENARRTASGSSFYWAMRLLAPEKREAMYAIYRFCRAVDDIADDVAASDASRAAGLEEWRRSIALLYGGDSSGEAEFLRAPMQRFALREEDFLSVIEGMQMDAAGAIIAPDLATLDHYCDCVASAVGRLSIRVFGMEDEPGFALAHHLGRALQLTNILRDLDEDAGLGRLYLPRELLAAAGIPVESPSLAIARAHIDPVCRGVAEIATKRYRDAETVLDGNPCGDLRPPRLMAAVYSATLSRMQQRGWTAPRERIRVPKPMLIWFVLRYGLLA